MIIHSLQTVLLEIQKLRQHLMDDVCNSKIPQQPFDVIFIQLVLKPTPAPPAVWLSCTCSVQPKTKPIIHKYHHHRNIIPGIEKISEMSFSAQSYLNSYLIRKKMWHRSTFFGARISKWVCSVFIGFFQVRGPQIGFCWSYTVTPCLMHAKMGDFQWNPYSVKCVL